MIALSIRQPWAWLILNAGKDIENRDWKTEFRGRTLIHASKSGTRRDYEEALDFLAARSLDRLLDVLPAIDKFDRGGIVGSVEIFGCTDDSQSPWFVGDYGFMLRNPKPLPFVPFKGRLGFFNVDGIQP